MDQSPIQQIKDRLNIVDVIGDYLKLQKAGANYKALCPFHNEKTPSFSVSTARQNYHCFGCGASGDVIEFVKEIEGLDFPETIKLLADRAGVNLQQVDYGENKKQNRLFRLMDEATNYYQQKLATNKEALSYLKNRGLSEETIRDFRLGWAPADWQNVSEYLKDKDWTEKDMIDVGLVLRSASSATAPHGRLYDRFRSRIMFPLFDASGRPVGFSGRIFGPASDDPKIAKYINSPATVLYDKSKVLYGFDRAKSAIRQKGYCLLVEGQMDIILAHQVGTTEAVAVSGTALSNFHLEMIKRLTDTMVMAFDADLAGVSASARAVDLALELGFEVRAIKLPSDLDPADIIAKNPAEWLGLITETSHVIDFYLFNLVSIYSDKRELNKAIREKIYPYIARLAYQTDQAHFISKIADLLHLPEDAVWSDFKKILRPNFSSGTDNSQKELVKVSKDKLDLILDKLIGLFWWQEKVEGGLSTKELEEKILEALSQSEWQEYLKKYQPRQGELIMAVENVHSDDPPEILLREFNDLLKGLKLEILNRKLKIARLSLKEAETSGDEERVDKLLKECQTISQTINQIK